MGAEVLSSRAIIGMFYELLEQNTGASWIDVLSNLFDSDQESETYKWLGQSPAMRERDENTGARLLRRIEEHRAAIQRGQFGVDLS